MIHQEHVRYSTKSRRRKPKSERCHEMMAATDIPQRAVRHAPAQNRNFAPSPDRELRPRILMVETAKNFDRGDPTDAPNGSRKRRVLIERQMSPRRIVIRDVR